MYQLDYIKYPKRIANGVECVSKRSLDLAERNGKGRQIYTHDGDPKSSPILVNLQDINPGLFATRCTFSHLSDFAAALCTLDPEDVYGDKVIRGRTDHRTFYYSAAVSKERLIDLAIDNEPMSYKSLWHEITRKGTGKHSITAAVDLGDGVVMIMPLFRITPIIVSIERLHGRLKADCERLGINCACIGYEIEFLKELFRACFPGATGHDGYIKLGKAFFAKFRRTVAELKEDKEERGRLLSFRNPRTGQYFELSNSKAYYKMILYLLTHFSSNTLANSLTLEGDELIEVFAQVCPSLLKMDGGKPRIRNIFDAKLFIDKSSWILNSMARKGFCESALAVTERSLYHRLPDGGFGVKIFYNRDASKLRTPIYTSNLLEGDCPF